MDSTLCLTYNAADCKLTNHNDDLLNLIKLNCLTWQDNSVQMQNNRYRFKHWHKPKDPNRYCLEIDNTTGEVCFPTGLLIRVISFLESKGIKYDLDCQIEPLSPGYIPYPDWAYQHQIDIRDKLFKTHRCICRSGTGSGKSTSISMLCTQFPEDNIIIVLHELNLMLDMQSTLQEFLKEDIGIVSSKKQDWKRITVASGKTLSLHGQGKYATQCQQCRVLIFDECHHYANNTGVAISKACFNTAYRLGLSATPEIENGADRVLEGVIGPIALYIEDSVTIELGACVKPVGMFIQTDSTKYPVLPTPYGELKPDRSEVVKRCLIENEWRNQLIVSVVEQFRKLCPVHGIILIAIADVKYGQGEAIKQLLQTKGIESDFISGKSKNRKESTDEFRYGNLDVLIATSILNEGIDIPNLELVLNAGGGSGKRNVWQITGRASRIDKTGIKQRAIYIDFIDEEVHYLESNSFSRLQNFNECHPGCGKIVTLEQLFEFFVGTYPHLNNNE